MANAYVGLQGGGGGVKRGQKYAYVILEWSLSVNIKRVLGYLEESRRVVLRRVKRPLVAGAECPDTVVGRFRTYSRV